MLNLIALLASVSILVTLTQSQQLLLTSPIKKSDALPYNIINELLYKCKDLKSLNTCDMCSLCQNGAMCQQKPRPQQQQQQYNNNNNNMYPTYGGYNSNLYQAQTPPSQVTFELLRSLIDFTCYCVPGHTGTYCQINVDECLSRPCSNNSTCIDGVNKYECKCPAGYTGKQSKRDFVFLSKNRHFSIQRLDTAI